MGDKEKPTLVLMHGYGGSGVVFWKIMKPLIEHFYLILVDVIGMGGSSRPKFKIQDSEEAEVYLVDWFEKWRIEMGNLTGFILAGHSFGGYICGLYAVKHHQHIVKLLLMSPLGVPKKPEGFSLEELMQGLPSRRKPPRCL